MNCADRPRSRRPSTCYEPEDVERFVAEKMQKTLTFTSGACHSVLVGLGKGRFAQLVTPCFVPAESTRVFACRYGVRNGQRGVRFLWPVAGETESDFERLMGLTVEDKSVFNAATPFYGPKGEALQGKSLSEIVLGLAQIARRSDLSRNEQGYVPSRIEGALPLSALPVAKGQGRCDFYRAPLADYNGPG